LPTLEQGKYKPDEQDELEQQRQEEFLREIREDMGYSRGPQALPEKDSGGADAGALPLHKPEEAVPVPMSPGSVDGNGGGGGEMPPPPPPPEGMDGGDIPPPPPPPPPPEDMGGGDQAGFE